MATCKKHNIIVEHVGRQVHVKDFTTFTHILASDDNNLRNLRQVTPKNSTAEVRLFGSYDDGKVIPDPYYGGIVSDCTFHLCTNSDDVCFDRMGLRKSTNNASGTQMPSWMKLWERNPPNDSLPHLWVDLNPIFHLGITYSCHVAADMHNVFTLLKEPPSIY